MSGGTISGADAGERERIYVALRGEGIDVWRPVDAARLPDGTYLILDQDYDRDVETREFEPGTVVRCRREGRDGVVIAVAAEAVAPAAAG